MRMHVISGKALADFTRVKRLIPLLAIFLAIPVVIAGSLAQTMPDDIASMPLAQQEQELMAAFGLLSFVWVVGIPVLVLAVVLAATSLAQEAERGLLRILLSKPIRRWEIVLGTFLAIFGFVLMLTIAGTFAIGAMVFAVSGASASAVSGGIIALVPATLVYAGIVSYVVAAIGVSLAVLTQNRLKTVVIGLVLPVLFIAFILIRLVTRGAGAYVDYYLYIADLSYHFGNLFIVIHELFGTNFSPTTQVFLSTATGAHDVTGAGIDPLLGGMPSTVPYTGHFAPALSGILLIIVATGLLLGALVYFTRTDVT